MGTDSGSSEHNFHPSYRPDIDGLRALAILPVVAYHAFPRWAPGGFVGVDIFFVISGYLISLIIFKSLLHQDFRFSEFFARRIKRIFPALILVASMCYVLGWFTLLPDEFKQLGKHIAAGMGFVQNFVLWKEAGYFDIASDSKPLMHLWSLAIEEQFYLVYPLLAWLVWRARLNMLTLVVVLGLASFWLSRKGVHEDAVKTFFAPHTRFWELMAGSMLAYVQAFRCWPPAATRWAHRIMFNRVVFRQVPAEENRAALLASSLSVLGLLLIVYAIAGFDRSTPYPGSRALAPVLGALLLILAGPQAWVNRQLLARRALVWVGLISYPLYLWHWPLLSFARIVESATPSREVRIGAVVISFVLAALTYWLIEKPIRYGRPTWRKTATLCALAVVVGYIGYNAHQRNGLAFRVKDVVARNAMFNRPIILQDERCKLSFPPKIESAFCWLAKDGAPTIQLIGDSHGAPLYAGMRDLLEETSENVFYLAGNGCAPFFDVFSFDRKDDEASRRHCLEITNQALSIAETSSTIHTVILASRGPFYLSGKGFFTDDLPDEKGHDRIIRSAAHPELEDHDQIWEVAMRETLNRLLAKGKRIVFILDNPELGFDPKSCVDSRPWRLTTRVRQPCAIPRHDFDARNRKYRELVAAVLKDYPAVRVFDAAAQLCDEQWCWAMKEGRMLYLDDDHLSLDGARLLARELVKQIAQ
jgi:peptidoglycan/LPS O-acetylase OafA/YrhL